MNNTRRASLKEAQKLILKAQEIVNNVKFEEDMAFGNLTEGLQQTMRGETMENNVEVMDEIDEAIDELLDKFDEIE